MRNGGADKLELAALFPIVGPHVRGRGHIFVPSVESRTAGNALSETMQNAGSRGDGHQTLSMSVSNLRLWVHPKRSVVEAGATFATT